jgi:hypothetical protein
MHNRIPKTKVTFIQYLLALAGRRFAPKWYFRTLPRQIIARKDYQKEYYHECLLLYAEALIVCRPINSASTLHASASWAF